MKKKDLKKISILIPFRQEKDAILLCLEHLKTSLFEFLENNEFQNHKVEILLGDDNDTAFSDSSTSLVQRFIKQNPQLPFRYFKINKEIENNLKSKVKVTNFLIAQTDSEVIIFLDADIFVTQNWLSKLLKYYYQNSQTKMLMGTTIPQPFEHSFFEKWQILDWLFGQGVLYFFSKMKFPQTAMGNNLIFDRKIYEEIGGFQKIPLSITEDLALFKSFQNHLKNDFFKQLFSVEALAKTKAEPTFKKWLLQRHRWLCGAWQLNSVFKKGALLIYLFRPLLLLLTLWSVYFVFPMIFLWITNLVLLIYFSRKLKIKQLSVFHLLTFSLTELFLYVTVGVYFLFSKKVVWKEKKLKV